MTSSEGAASWSLQGKLFRVVSTDSATYASPACLFQYFQDEKDVWANYTAQGQGETLGNKAAHDEKQVRQGHLIGKVVSNNKIVSRFHHMAPDGALIAGESGTSVDILPDGRLRLRENWVLTVDDQASGHMVLEEFRMPPALLETADLRLRPYQAEDLSDHVAIMSDWEVTKWVSVRVPYPYSIEAGRDFFIQVYEEWAAGQAFTYAIEEKATGKLIGGIRLLSFKEQAEVGYWLSPTVQGRGYGLQALKAVADMALGTGVIQRLMAMTWDHNTASCRILEKAGFILQGDTPAEMDPGGHLEAPDQKSIYYILEKT